MPKKKATKATKTPAKPEESLTKFYETLAKRPRCERCVARGFAGCGHILSKEDRADGLVPMRREDDEWVDRIQADFPSAGKGPFVSMETAMRRIAEEVAETRPRPESASRKTDRSK